MGAYVKNKDGKFAGSIGEGRDRVPTARPAMLPGQVEEPSTAPGVADMYESFTQRREERAAAQVAAAQAAVVDLSAFRVDTSYPVPQANSLAKVAAAVDAIEDGACTDDAVAHAIQVTPRQGAYYANAAAYLGLVTQSGQQAPREWTLTPAGAEFLNANAPTRAEILGHVVAQIPEVDAVLHDGADVEELYSHQLGESTAARRAATTEAWMDTLTDRSKAAAELTLETDGVRDRIDAARQVAVDARAAARRKATVERSGSVCPRCFTTMPLAGGCPSCDD